MWGAGKPGLKDGNSGRKLTLWGGYLLKGGNIHKREGNRGGGVEKTPLWRRGGKYAGG